MGRQRLRPQGVEEGLLLVAVFQEEPKKAENLLELVRCCIEVYLYWYMDSLQYKKIAICEAIHYIHHLLN